MIAWEYGPIAPGAFVVETLCLLTISKPPCLSFLLMSNVDKTIELISRP